MKNSNRSAVAYVQPMLLLMVFFSMSSFSYAEGEMTVSPQISFYDVKDDKGRFRQDWRVPTGVSGGISEFSTESKDGNVRMEGHAIFLNDFSNLLLIKLPQDSYLKINGKYFRQYYDGSNEPWDPALYLLGSEYADWEDDDLYADRFTQNFEYGRAVDKNTNLAIGYNVWTRFGRERLLRGEQAAATGQISRRSIPARAYIEGTSHTWYAEYAHTTAQDYNVRIKPSLEMYKDYQNIQFPRYSSGVLSQDRTFLDSPQFQNLLVEANADKFMNDNTFLYSGYLFNYLKNGSVRSEVRPVKLTPTFLEPNVDNERLSNTGNLGAVLVNFLNINNLRLSASTRVEGADTNSRGYGLGGSPSVYRESRSDTGEFWTSESIDLSYSGIRKLNLGLGVDLDQRRFDYNEFFDAGSHEIFTTSAWGNNPPQFMTYNTDIFYNDLKTTARATYRLNPHVKFRNQYKYKYQDRDYDTNTDSSTVYYPGVLGDTRKEAHEVSTGMDIWWLKSWSSGLQYQYIKENFRSQASGEDSDEINRHRVTASISGEPVNKLSVFSSATIENYYLDTPTSAPTGSTWFAGTTPYDYDGSYFVYNLNANWNISEKKKLYCGFQQTRALGAQHNVLDNFSAGIAHKINEDSEFSAEYAYFAFRDKNDVVAGFDDYHGNGLLLTYKNKF